MNTRAAPAALLLAALLLAAPLLQGCVAVAIPVVAAGAMARSEIKRDAVKQDQTAMPATPAIDAAPIPSTAGKAVDAAAVINNETATLAAASALPVPSPSLTPLFANLTAHVASRRQLAAEGAPILSLVLAEPVTLAAPRYANCRAPESAVLIDLDDGSDGPAAQAIASDAVANTDMIAAAAAMRAGDVRLIWITGQPASDTPAIAARLRATAIDPDGVDQVIGVSGADDRKQLLRKRLADRYCILAVVGDRRGDADEAYDYLRNPDTPLLIDSNWGSGWFLLPAPLTSSAPSTDAGPSLPQPEEP